MQATFFWAGILALGQAVAFGMAPSLEGRWGRECQPGMESNTSFLPSIRVTGKRLRYTLSFFEGEGCKTPTHDYRWHSYFTLGEEDAATKIAPVDFELSAIWVIPRSEKTAEKFSGESYCGLSHWKKHGPKLVTGKKCGGNQLGSKGYVAYNVLRQVENSLELSPEASVGEESKRPGVPGPSVFHRE